jgi:hypothetical protein
VIEIWETFEEDFPFNVGRKSQACRFRMTHGNDIDEKKRAGHFIDIQQLRQPNLPWKG